MKKFKREIVFQYGERLSFSDGYTCEWVPVLSFIKRKLRYWNSLIAEYGFLSYNDILKDLLCENLQDQSDWTLGWVDKRNQLKVKTCFDKHGNIEVTFYNMI